MKRMMLTSLLFVVMLGSAFFGTGTNNADASVSYSYWFNDGSSSFSKLYFYPGGGQPAMFTGIYMDEAGGLFYYHDEDKKTIR